MTVAVAAAVAAMAAAMGSNESTSMAIASKLLPEIAPGPPKLNFTFVASASHGSSSSLRAASPFVEAAEAAAAGFCGRFEGFFVPPLRMRVNSSCHVSVTARQSNSALDHFTIFSLCSFSSSGGVLAASTSASTHCLSHCLSPCIAIAPFGTGEPRVILTAHLRH